MQALKKKNSWKGNAENEKNEEMTQANLKDIIAQNFLELITNINSQFLVSILRYYIMDIQNPNEIKISQ